MRALITAGVALVLTTAVPAQQLGVLNGRVLDLTGAMLPGVTVTAAGGVQRAAVTQPDGEYRIENLPAGPYTITAEIPGFLTATHLVELRAGEIATLDFRLRLGCIGEVNPPLWVRHPFTEMLDTVDVVAHVRIRNVGDRERVMTDTSCMFVRQVDVDVLDSIDTRGSSPELRTLRFNAGVGNDRWSPATNGSPSSRVAAPVAPT